MNCKKIIEVFLTENHYDGLFLEDTCGCLNEDLMPCGDSCESCRPGYKYGKGDSWGIKEDNEEESEDESVDKVIEKW
jgi:hypothetical protein